MTVFCRRSPVGLHTKDAAISQRHSLLSFIRIRYIDSDGEISADTFLAHV